MRSLVMLGALLCSAGCGWTASRFSFQRYSNNHLMTSEMSKQVAASLEILTKGTRFENRWQINESPVSDRINIYLVYPTESDTHGNCAYIGRDNVIICDSEFLFSFLSPKKYFKGYPLWIVEKNRRAFVTWVIGHEIGHLTRGRAAHFKPSGFEREVASSSLARDEELTADRFAFQQINKDQSSLVDVGNVVIGLLNSEIFDKVGEVPQGMGILYDYNNKKMVTYLEQGNHPEFVIRCTRILELISAKNYDPLISYQVRKFAAQLSRH